jgi:hypothetical protein
MAALRGMSAHQKLIAAIAGSTAGKRELAGWDGAYSPNVQKSSQKMLNICCVTHFMTVISRSHFMGRAAQCRLFE